MVSDERENRFAPANYVLGSAFFLNCRLLERDRGDLISLGNGIEHREVTGLDHAKHRIVEVEPRIVDQIDEELRVP
jgi:hypothetical protein